MSLENFIALDQATFPENYPRKPWWKRYAFGGAWGLFAVTMFALLFIQLPDGCVRWLASYRGSIAIGLAANLLFLLVGLDINQKSSDAVARVDASVSALAVELPDAQRIAQIDEFMRQGEWENIALLKQDGNHSDLTFRITPVRDARGPFIYRDEFATTNYLVHVASAPTHVGVTPERGAAYAGSPLRIGKHAFIRFYNHRWNIGHGTVPSGWQPFVLAGKVSGAAFNVTADAFVEEERKRRTCA